MGCKDMTKIQAESLPHILDNKDVLGHAYTGSEVLVISPTRTLAREIAAQSAELLKFRDKHATQVLVGGVSRSHDIHGFSGQAPSVLIATPGRLLDHLRSGELIYEALQHVETLVLDEADALLDMGFGGDIEAILELLPKNRQTLLFSATAPPAENRNQDGGSNFSSQSSQRGRSRARGGRRGGGWRRNNSARSKDRGDDTVSRSYGEESGNSRNNSNNRRRRQRKPRSARENAPLAANSHASAKTNELDAVFEASSTETSSTFDKPSFITDQAFEEAPISTFSKRAISEVMGHKYMTKIQAESLPHVLGNKDVLGRARTGTGKTVAFLLPTIERIFGTEKSRSSRGTQVLVISPTRELAKQIATQSTELLKFRNEHATQVFMGGTNKSRDIRGFRGQAPSVLVATPGRLLDHLRTSDLIYDALQHVETLVLDEADVLLDMGFRRDVEAILKLLPKNRQTLLFSATTPPGLHEVISLALKNDFVTIDCISDGDANDDNNDNLHAHVPQRHVVLPSIETLVAALRAVITNDGQQGKFVVFFPTARVVGFFATLFRDVFRIPVLELHSRKSQNVRTRTSQQFRDARYGVLFTSDVSARGVDYPHVSHVVQVGMPSSKEQYIHRVGRTGRAGKEGQGLLMLCPFESVFLRDLRDMDVPRCDEWHTRLHDPQLQEESDKIRETLRREVRRSSNFHKAATQAYQAFLGFYNSNLKKLGWNKNKVLLVDKANEFAQVIGFDESPALLKRTVGKMGLKGVRGLRVQ